MDTLWDTIVSFYIIHLDMSDRIRNVGVNDKEKEKRHNDEKRSIISTSLILIITIS